MIFSFDRQVTAKASFIIHSLTDLLLSNVPFNSLSPRRLRRRPGVDSGLIQFQYRLVFLPTTPLFETSTKVRHIDERLSRHVIRVSVSF